jgi:hypothetical protein
MTRPATFFAAFALTCSVVVPAGAQISSWPTDPPVVTAENQAWYLSGEPIAFGGGIFYPTGPITHFVRNEMVPAGAFDNVTIYVRTTIERGSIIYVPLAGGVVRPYERRRTGDLAGTSGSMAPSFPVVLPSDPRAQAEDSAAARVPGDILARVVNTSSFPGAALQSGPAASPGPDPIGTAGMLLSAPARPVATHMETVQRPVGLNGVFVQFDNARWFASGGAVELVPGRFTQIGDYRGFPVYRDQSRPDTIYVALLAGSPGLLSPYTSR